MWKKPLDFSSLTLTSYFLRMIFEETTQTMATGTGFIYEYEDIKYLITNGHNVTRVNPETNQRLGKYAGFPTLIQTRAFIEVETDKDKLVPELFAIDLYKDEYFTKPEWYVHPKFGYAVDVIAIPIDSHFKVPEHVRLFPINNIKFDDDFDPTISDDVFVLGFPFDANPTGKLEMPIWKRGSIATEVDFDLNGLPKLLIDTATRSGMSGSPVIYQRNGFHVHPSGNMGKNIFGRIRGFLGIYSGRLGADDNFKAQLGIVWKKSVIEEIIKGQKIGDIQFQSI